MNLLYLSSTCSNEKYSEYIESKNIGVLQQAQKYNLLLAQGLAEAGASVRLISSRPINRTVSNQFWFGSEREHVNKVDFSYVAFINRPILRNLTVFFGAFFRVLFSPFKRKDTAVICDALNISVTAAALLAAFFRGFNTVGIITDVPTHYCAGETGNSGCINMLFMKRFKKYLLLTEPMSAVVNPNNNPYVVLEGHADVSMKDIPNELADKYDKKVCVYAGSLRRIYGISNLVEGFIYADIADAELHIYGSGDYEDELKDLAAQHSNIKFWGVAPNSEVVKAELKATLLINPRPTNEDYTKYSFPSKNMEYMASGTPVLTTNLPGMPEEYKQYVYLLEDETAVGVKTMLTDILSKSPAELHDKGMAAKQFVLEQKNNVFQAQKVLEMIRTQ